MILFAKDTSGGKPEGTMYPLDELRFNLTVILRLQDSITEPFPRFCDRTIEKPIYVVDGHIVNLRGQKKNYGSDSDPSPSRQCDVLADAFAKVINGLVQEQHRQTNKEAKNGHATQRYAHFHDVGSAHSLADEEAKHTVDEIKQAPQLFGWRITRPKKIKKGRGCAGIREDECWQSNQAAPDHPAQALVVLWR